MNSAVLLHLGFVMWHPLNRAAENCTLALLFPPAPNLFRAGDKSSNRSAIITMECMPDNSPAGETGDPRLSHRSPR